VLIGDAGDAARASGSDGVRAVLRLVREDVAEQSQSAVVFLGDNVYPAGMPPAADSRKAERETAERTLAAQVEATSGAIEAIFVPGNHDWDQTPAGRRGLARVKAAEEFLATSTGGAARVRQLPADGCPGPAAVDFAPSVRLILIDTEWLLADDSADKKPFGVATRCRFGVQSADVEYTTLSRPTFYEALERVLRDSGSRSVLLLAHHPVESHGPHGGYGLNIFLNKEDFSSRPYGRMRADLRAALRRANHPVVYASGHEHSLQVLADPGGFTWLVSGSGSKSSAVSRGSNTVFKHGHVGYMRLDVLDDGRFWLVVIEPAATGARQTMYGSILTPAVPDK